jgi:membrane fusion protein (multidrug efflux system)
MPATNPMGGALRRATLAVALATLASAASLPAGAQAPQGQRPPVDVTFVTIQRRPVPVTTTLPGRTTAYRTAEVRPQVGGVLRERLFTEGQAVTQGQPLYQIDPAPFEASLASAQASLARAEATRRSAGITVNRYRPLVAARAVSQQDLDTAEATLRQAEADVASAQAAVETARINLAYTRVLSPLSGRTGRSSLTNGALVTASQTSALVTITQLDPIFVDVVQPSASLLRQRRAVAAGTLHRDSADTATARLILEDGTEYAHPGRIQFTEVIVDQGTGSVTLRAEFPNPDGLLLPGMFVRARVEEGTTDQAFLVPQQAVLRNARGQPVAYVVKPDDTVEPRMLTTDRAIGTDWLVTGGINDGDRVVVEGVMRLGPGARVNPTERPAQAAANPQRTGG